MESTSVRMGFMIDVAGYGRRSARAKTDVQQRVSALVTEVLRDQGLRLDQTYHHGTGDGMVVFLPGEIEVHRALVRLLRCATEVLAEDNQRYQDRMRLRMAVVIGPIGPAAIGFSGDAIVEAGRLVDSDTLRAAHGADLAVLISAQLYEHTVREGHAGLRHTDFRPVEVQAKEYTRQAWLWHGQPRPAAAPAAEPTTYTLAAAGGPACVIGIRPGRILRVHDMQIWVNSENTDMEMARFNEFSISSIIRYHGALRDAAGHVVDDVIAGELSRAVGGHRPVAPGAAFVTGPGALVGTHGVRRIIHVAAVQGEPGAGFRQIRHVGACVANALALAERLAADDPAIRFILFPMLGAGMAGASVTQTATELVAAAADHLESTPGSLLHGIRFLAYADAERVALGEALRGNPLLTPAP
ncbi:macro domain-containing protein [Actinoplanes couchii]|nr:macro domain-containing protein [Actinoplanes couchii]MDR6319984.1 O-acetyl-ADP-ribose deacetylase (regulator of RNase III) [Actinoplanes couchii]